MATVYCFRFSRSFLKEWYIFMKLSFVMPESLKTEQNSVLIAFSKRFNFSIFKYLWSTGDIFVRRTCGWDFDNISRQGRKIVHQDMRMVFWKLWTTRKNYWKLYWIWGSFAEGMCVTLKMSVHGNRPNGFSNTSGKKQMELTKYL